MHGGEALLESTLGEGTVVRVRLPYAAIDDKGERVAPPKPAEIVPFRGAA